MNRLVATLAWFVCLISVSLGSDIKVDAAYAISNSDGVSRLRVWLVVTNASQKEIAVPTGNLGPITHYDAVEQRQIISFKHVPQKLRSGRALVAAEASFLPVVLGKGESTVVTHTMVIGDEPRPKEVVVRYVVDEQMQQRYGFSVCDERAVATSESLF